MGGYSQRVGSHYRKMVFSAGVPTIGSPMGFITGDVYFVDPTSGSNSNDGRSKETAFATLQAGIDACTDNNGDVVIRMQGTENPTAAITFDCPGITVIAQSYGMNYFNQEKFSTYPAASYDSGPTAIITEPCAIIGLEFVTRNTTSGSSADMSDSGAAIAIDGDEGGYKGGFSLIKSCRFVDWWGNDYGIETRGGAYNRIEECTFDGFTAGILFGSGTRNPDYNQVVRCEFYNCTAGIEHKAGATPHHFLYQSNTFIDGKILDHNAQAADGLVCDNWCELAAGSAYDEAVADLQGDGINFSDNHYSE